MTAAGLRLTTADRSFGAGLTGALERGDLRGPVQLELRGAAGQSFGAFAGARRRAPARRPGQRLRRQGAVRRLGHDRAGAGPRRRPGERGHRRQHRPVRRDRRPAAPRRPGRDALRGPQLRRRGRRRGHRPARLRVHDRRHRRRPRPGRRQLRRRHDRRPGVPLRPDRPPRGRARRRQRRAPSGSRRSSPSATTARPASASSSAARGARDGRLGARRPAARRRRTWRPRFWVVEPIAPAGAAVATVRRAPSTLDRIASRSSRAPCRRLDAGADAGSPSTGPQPERRRADVDGCPAS